MLRVVGIPRFLADRKGVAWAFVLAVTVGHFVVGGSIANFGGTGVSLLIYIGFVVLELSGGLILGITSPARPSAGLVEHVPGRNDAWAGEGVKP